MPASLSGGLLDDDEVAVAHRGAEDGHRPVSTAMVDIQATLAAAACALGGLSGTQWRDVGVPALIVAAATAWAATRASLLNALILGDEGATGLGVEVDRLRLRLIVMCALVIGTVVAVSGGIGFVALMVPHAVRLAFGGDNRRLIPLAALTGALLLVWVDVAARMVNRPDEIPIGVITAVLGSPFFLMLLSRADRRGLR